MILGVIVVFLLSLGLTLNFFKHKLLPSVYLIVCIFFCLVYVVIPILMIVEPSQLNSTFSFFNLGRPYFRFDFSYWSSVLLFFTFFTGFYFIVKVSLNNREVHFESRNFVLQVIKIPVTVIFGMVFGLLGVWGLFYYVYQYGGFSEAILVANFVRSGAGENYQIGSNVFSYRFADMSFILIAVAMVTKRLFLKKVFWILSFPFFFYVIFLAKGKANLLALVLVPLIYIFLVRRNSYPIISLLAVAVMFIGLPILEAVLTIEGYTGETDYSRLVLLFGYQSLSVNAAIDSTTSVVSYSLLNDFFYGLGGTFLPTSVVSSITPYSSIELNTSLLTGKFERTVPPGPVAFSYYSFGPLGLFLIGGIYGGFVGVIDWFFSKNAQSKVVIFIYSCIIFMMTNIIYHGVPEFIFYGHRLFIAGLFLFVCFKIKLKRRF